MGRGVGLRVINSIQTVHNYHLNKGCSFSLRLNVNDAAKKIGQSINLEVKKALEFFINHTIDYH